MVYPGALASKRIQKTNGFNRKAEKNTNSSLAEQK